MESNLAALPGDGVGPAVGTQVLNLLQGVGEKLDQSFDLNEGIEAELR